MEMKISIEEPEFNKSGVTKKKCVVVSFPNCVSTTTKKPFKWMPTYDQLDKIGLALLDVEEQSWKNAKKMRENEKAKRGSK